MAGEFQASGLAIDLEDGDAVGSLVATVEELAGGVEAEAARIIAAGPLFLEERQVAFGTH